MDGIADPVDAGITSDGLVLRIDEDDLVVLVDTVLVDPVGLKKEMEDISNKISTGALTMTSS